MKIHLSGKTAIVTGSTGGIGFAIARGLADCGATVVVNGLTQAAVDRAVATVKASAPAGDVRGVAADLAASAGCGALVSAEPTCDILVNNVGIYGGWPSREANFNTSDDLPPGKSRHKDTPARPSPVAERLGRNGPEPSLMAASIFNRCPREMPSSFKL
jgi:NAD(P)-dependent dehydrogenase (short-subunit alcohol dehydrogenase family)